MAIIKVDYGTLEPSGGDSIKVTKGRIAQSDWTGATGSYNANATVTVSLGFKPKMLIWYGYKKPYFIGMYDEDTNVPDTYDMYYSGNEYKNKPSTDSLPNALYELTNDGFTLKYWHPNTGSSAIEYLAFE